jgi:hypothetical protein
MSQSDYTLTAAELPALRQFFQLQNLLGVGSPDFTDKSILTDDPTGCAFRQLPSIEQREV